jgi:anti-sigma factor RsiW
MSHPTYELIPYLHGQLEPGERHALEQHLAHCDACRSELDDLSGGLTLLRREIDRMPTPDWNDYRAELRQKLAARRDEPKRWWRINWVWGSLAATGVAAVLLLSLSVLHRPSTPAEAPIMDQLAMADTMSHADIGLFRDYPVVEHLDMLENYDVIEHLDELSPAAPQTNATTHQL